MANGSEDVAEGLSGHAVRGLVEDPTQPETVAHATLDGLEETVHQAAEFALRALDLTGQALGKAVDLASDKAFQDAANAGVSIATPPTAQLSQAGFSWSGYIQALGIMCVLLALLWFAVWAIRRYGKFNFLPRPGSLPRDSLIMEAQMPLGPRKGLMVVRFMNRRLLLGVTEHQISLITEDGTEDDRGHTKFEGFLENARDADDGHFGHHSV